MTEARARGARPAPRPSATLPLALGCTGLSALALHDVARAREPLAVLLGPAAPALLAALLAATALALLATFRLLRALHQPPGAGVPGLPWHVAFEVLVAAAVVHLLLLQPYRELLARATLGVAAGLVALLVLCGPRLARAVPRRMLSAADLLAFGLAVTLVCGELGLSAWAGLSRSPLLAREDESVAASIARNRLDPASATPDEPVTSGGHRDTEFPPAGAIAPRAACLGDSFSVGVVPHAFHFTSVAERELGRGRLDNLGFTGTGLPVYLELLRREALPLRPDVVVVNLFVGNDLTEGLHDARDVGWLRRALDARQVLLAVVPRRLLQLRGEALAPAPAPAPGATGPPRSLDELRRDLPWLDDPRLEVPAFSAERFATVERRRAQGVCAPDSGPAFARAQRLLAQMRAACGETPFAVVLIPDEFQVEDDVWELVRSAPGGEALDRDRPQRVLGEWLAAQGIPCLDLLPVLRAVPPLEDGRRHLFHLRDTHFNARGNEVAGHALAGFLAPWWE